MTTRHPAAGEPHWLQPRTEGAVAEITDPDPGVLDAELAALGGSVTRRAARDVYAELQGR